MPDVRTTDRSEPGGSTGGSAHAGRPECIGRYSFTVRTGTWWWSDMFYRILGFEPGEIAASAAVLAAHLRPDGMERGIEAFQDVLENGEAFTVHSRIVDGHGRERIVLLAGHGEAEAGAPVESVHGYLADLTDARREASLVDVQEALARALEHRAVIE